MDLDVNNLETELTELLNTEFGNLLDNAKAIVSIEHEKHGTSFSITPYNENQTKIVVFYQNGSPLTYLTIGENTTMEVPITGERYTKSINLDELFILIHSVISNGLEETIWRSRDEIIKSIAKLLVKGESEPILIKEYKLYNPFIKKLSFVKKYVSYFENKNRDVTKLQIEVNKILARWNPIGVNSNIASDEYVEYIPIILKAIEDENNLMNCLEDILVNQMQLEYDSSNKSHKKDLQNICDELLLLIK